MGARLQRIVAQYPDASLPRPVHHVLQRLADYADDTTGERACPSRATLALETRYSVRTIQWSLNFLKRIGLIVAYGHSRRYRTVLYRLNLERLYLACGKLVEKLWKTVRRRRSERVQTTAAPAPHPCNELHTIKPSENDHAKDPVPPRLTPRDALKDEGWLDRAHAIFRDWRFCRHRPRCRSLPDCFRRLAEGLRDDAALRAHLKGGSA